MTLTPACREILPLPRRNTLKMSVDNTHVLIVIAGPTAVGKTAVAIALARHFETEIISADSRQLFKELNIGTAKPSYDELTQVKHHFISSHPITEHYDAAQYGVDALEVINDLFKTRKYAVLCGGSGLYIKAVCEGFDEIPEVPEEVRARLVASYEQEGLRWLQAKMQELDPEQFAKLDAGNPHRLIRALEVKIATGKSIAQFRKGEKRRHHFSIVKIGLELPREELYKRIDLRMGQMIQSGLFEEAKSLYPFRNKNALQTVGYQEIFRFMESEYDYDEAVRLLKRNSRRYAKRQLTWFKKDTDFTWFAPTDISGMIKHIKTQ